MAEEENGKCQEEGMSTAIATGCVVVNDKFTYLFSVCFAILHQAKHLFPGKVR